MSPEMEALRSHKGVVASVIAAAIGFTIFCLVGVAVLLGWIGPGVRPMVGAPRSAAAPAPAPASVPGLSPGETVVAAGPVAAQPPAEAKPAPAAAPAPAATRKPVAEPKRPRKPTYGAAPRAPDPVRREGAAAGRSESASPSLAAAPHPSDANDPWPQPVCGACGVVHSITTFPDLWEVRVRFDDGGRRTIRYHRPPRWRVGDRIRYEDGRLQQE